jgi:Lhr-like helicase
MYEIILKTWYPETPYRRNTEVYKNLSFEDMEEAVEYLSNHLESILDEFPVDGEIKIKYNQELSLD